MPLTCTGPIQSDGNKTAESLSVPGMGTDSLSCLNFRKRHAKNVPPSTINGVAFSVLHGMLHRFIIHQAFTHNVHQWVSLKFNSNCMATETTHNSF